MANRLQRSHTLSRLCRLLERPIAFTTGAWVEEPRTCQTLPSLAGALSLARGYASSTQREPSASRGPVSYASLALTAVTGAGLLYWLQHLKEQKLKEASVKEETAGKAMIGGPFELVDQDGKPFTDRDLLGEFALIYFGFTNCPDICPDELEKLAAAIDQVDKKTQRKIQPVFISIDPERDSIGQVKSYISEFHPRLIGLTGSKQQVESAARQYRVYFTKTSETEDYLVDHSIITYLIDPEGRFVTFFGKNFTAEQLSSSIASHVKQWQQRLT